MSNNEKHLIVVCGPTASGKTKLAIHLARYYHAEIFSADARQFYREMNIGTAKPDINDLEAIPHHFIDNLSIHEEYTAGKYEHDVLAALTGYFFEHNIAILCGGSGLFIRAVCEGLEVKQSIPESIRETVRGLSLNELQSAIKKSDPEYFEQVDRSNSRRLSRALEVILSSGKKMSEQHTGHKKERPFSIHIIGTDLPRNLLYERINQRVDQMIDQGLEKEAKTLYPFKHLQPLQTVGYKEWFDFMENKQDKTKTVELIKQNTRHYAKRQITWFKKTPGLQWFHPDKHEQILQWLNSKLIQ